MSSTLKNPQGIVGFLLNNPNRPFEHLANLSGLEGRLLPPGPILYLPALPVGRF